MQFYFSSLLIFYFIGVLKCRQSDIDVNRIKLLATRLSTFRSNFSKGGNRLNRSYVYDDHSSGISNPSVSLQLPLHPEIRSKAESPYKVYQPKEDPRLYYQSDTYLQKTRSAPNNEVTAIYPGRNVVRANELIIRDYDIPKRNIDRSRIDSERLVSKQCIQCPVDRTLVAKPGSNRVLLENPKLFACSGRRAHKSVHFVHWYGPKFGSFIGPGSHYVIGKITQKQKTLQLCKMKVHVIANKVNVCSIPKYLKADCDHSELCTFNCLDISYELVGASSLYCGKNRQWQGNLPHCKARTWCTMPPPPDHAINLQCQGIQNSGRLKEGAKCKVHCKPGWRRTPAIAVCRRGSWSNNISCQPKRASQTPKTAKDYI